MKLTNREKWMCALLPAVLTVIVYQRAFMAPREAELGALGKQIQTQGPLAARTAAQKLAAAERMSLERRVAERRKAANLNGTFQRTLALQEISQRCESGGLTLISSAPDKGARLPASWPSPAAPAAGESAAGAPEAWHLELQGSYPAMVEFLDGLAQSSTLVVPLNIGMAAPADDTLPLTWTLTVWL